MGATFGAAWTPCVGPLLGVALVAATRSGGAVTGGILLGAYAAGLGVPFVLAAIGLDAFPSLAVSVLRRGRRPGAALQRVGGAVLVLLGGLLVTGRYSALVSLLARWRR
jgi:cytochrome c-type biogenesis protein